MINAIIIVALLFIIGLACFYVFKEKKTGKRCIGCPCSGTCKGKCRK